ncbi:MAG TPA: MlaD family protein [Solirubrobacteraceae bacterium]|nr:MlaD family protein [Solirubrobacteraceae bacterium]
MQKRAPTLANMIVIILFVLSCFGLLLFLWESFGGPLPLKSKGYRFNVSFPRSLALAEQSDVRISGVDIGHVVAIKKGLDGRTHAQVEVASKYAPIREDMHAILRQKSLLGETYVQLIPQGNGKSGAELADNGTLPDSQVERSVTLDDILAAFDPKTRRDFQVWQESVAEGINGRGEQINAGFAELQPFSGHANRLVTILNSQEGAVKDLIKNTGVVFNALASRDHQLEGSIVNGERTFNAAARASQAFATAFRELPPFEKNSTRALKELDAFAKIASPYLDEFKPAETKLSALLTAAKPFVPEFNGFLTAVGPLTKAANKGLPDVKKTLDLTIPILENLRPVLHNLDPFLQFTGQYVPEFQAFFANVTAASENSQSSSNVLGVKRVKPHFLTTMAVLSPDSLSIYEKRLGTNRANAYTLPGAFNSLASGLPVFSSSNCADSAPSVEGPPNEAVTETVLELLQSFGVTNKEGSTTNSVAAPPCTQQGPFTFNGKTSQFPKVVYEGKK